jgi:hypothetical protein
MQIYSTAIQARIFYAYKNVEYFTRFIIIIYLNFFCWSIE